MKFEKRSIVVCLITILFVFLAFHDMNFHEFLVSLKGADFKILWMIFPLLVLTMIFRGLRLHYLLSKNSGLSLKELVGICFAGGAMNVCFPARLGDFFRAFYIGGRGNCSKAKVLGSIVLERIFDGLSVLGLLFCGIVFFGKNELATKLCTTAAFLFLGAILFVFFLYKFNKTDTICSFLTQKAQKLPSKISSVVVKAVECINKLLNSFISGFEAVNSLKLLVMIVFWSILIWIFECFEYYVTVKSLGLDTGISISIFITSFVALSSAIPSASIFIGLYQYAVVEAMALYGIPKEPALVFGIIHPFIQTIFLILIGAIFILKNNINLNEISKEAKILQGENNADSNKR